MNRRISKRTARRIRRRIKWLITRILPVCFIAILVLGGVGYGICSVISIFTAKPAMAAEVTEEMQEPEPTVVTDGMDRPVTNDEATSAEAEDVVATVDLDATVTETDTLESSEAMESDSLSTGEFYAEEASYTTGLGDDVLAEYGILIDPKSNTIISSRKGKERMVPASMTKVLTLLVAAEHVQNLDDKVTITAEMGYYAYKNGLSIVGFKENEEVTVRDLMYGTILPSGGDAAMALAIYVAGSHEAFVDLMNEKAVQLGLGETSHFTNCAGVYDENHYSTCYDIAIIMEAAMSNPICRPILTERKYVTSSTTEHPDGIEISNWFLRRIEDKDCGGANVLYAKTGYVKESGHNSVSYAQAEDGTGYICVTVNSGSTWKCIYDHVRIYSRIFSVAG